MSNKEGIYSNDRDVGAPEEGSILAEEEARENARSTPGAFHIPGPQAGMPLAPADGDQSQE
eukprot:5433819-Ditylum_brightwellii.AAC.1